MQVIILAGGLGTRISEESEVRPKPMIEIGGKPILWHIMKIYAAHGMNDFILCGGYKSYMIKEYFQNYFLHQSDVTFDIGNNRVEYHGSRAESWRITVLDTGEDTMTGGRLLRARRYLDGDGTVCVTYGDGVSDIDLTREVAFHREHGRLATLAAVAPPGRFGALEIDGTVVNRFHEKPRGDETRINGGFFVVEPQAFDRIDGDATSWELEPLESLARDRQLGAYKHDGFWQPMDTLRDKRQLEALWTAGAPWKIWE
ncbi:glucose-1-phosphate cytidylyltransferase [Breoghania sp. L-A4]|uniref:glucose-1-phosphate cytidylyltransferase n=1 Tax=Breoghania sp. L-A4 TaxID=2304600 RepID=UPI000E35F90A|nr:glucose-1-phosphate cytidylyltransferase [Breoghania sp. L-A4]AXS40433.1 glucose-1-phosphate cytidylyltransferase [Breoghania sp. L-A4]